MAKTVPMLRRMGPTISPGFFENTSSICVAGPRPVTDPARVNASGVERVKPILTRGVLVDVAGYKGVETLPTGYEVTLADVRGALARQQLTESDIRPGDALLFNFGWWRLWPDPARVIPKLFLPGQEVLIRGDSRAEPVIRRLMQLPETVVQDELAATRAAFATRYRDLDALLMSRFAQIAPPFPVLVGRARFPRKTQLLKLAAMFALLPR